MPKTNVDLSNIDLFLKSLIKEVGMDKLPSDLQKQIFNDLKLRLNQRFYFLAINNLNERQLQELDQLVEIGVGQDEITRFLLLNIENFAEKSQQVLENFRNEYLEISNIKPLTKNHNSKIRE